VFRPDDQPERVTDAIRVQGARFDGSIWSIRYSDKVASDVVRLGMDCWQALSIRCSHEMRIVCDHQRQVRASQRRLANPFAFPTTTAVRENVTTGKPPYFSDPSYRAR
jgi:hypothetical protein